MIRYLRLFLFAPLIAGCSFVGAGELSTAPQALRVYQGTLHLVFADGVETARLDQADGECLGVSLPKKDINILRDSGPRGATVKGLLLQSPNDIEVATIRVNGRRIGFKQCDNRYIFVRRSDDITWQEEKSRLGLIPLLP